MSEAVIVKSLLSARKSHYGTTINDADAFEIFCAETVLKPFSLNFDAVVSGIVDGKDDGGIDSAYFFVNKTHIDIDTDLSPFSRPVEVELHVIQSKLDNGFSETAIAKLQTSLPELLRLDADVPKLKKLYNDKVNEFFEKYRESLKDLTTQFPSVSVFVYYITLATVGNSKVDSMLSNFQNAVEQRFPSSVCQIQIWGAARLYEEAQKQNAIVSELPFVKSEISHGKGYVLLSPVREYYNFITQDSRLIDTYFEFNVRDYQSSASVNQAIAETLKSDDDSDFWWLNNGVTIIAEKAQSQDNKITIKNPLIVNGLQTSHEIFRYFQSGGTDSRNRCVQVRVLEVTDERLRDKIIKATNSQTGIKPASLRATEPLQFKIEQFLSQNGVFYDRRKDYWRNRGKPSDRIIGIERLAQSLLAVLRERPHHARARPTTLIKDDKEYISIFSDKIDLKIYIVCANLYFLIDKFFRVNCKTVEAIYKNNLRYHIMMQAAWKLNKARPIHAKALRDLDVGKLSDSDLMEILNHTIDLFNQLGKEDKIAKGEEFTEKLISNSLVKSSKNVLK